MHGHDSTLEPRDTSFASDLAPACQSTAIGLETARTHRSREEGSGEAPPNPTFGQRALRAIIGILSSNNFYTSVGNIVLTSSLYSGALLHPACAVLAFTNEARERQRELGHYRHPPPRFSGIAQHAIDLWRSPGVYRVALSAAFMVNAAESFASMDLLFTAIYLCASLGNIGAARTLNRDYYANLNAQRGDLLPRRESTVFNLLTSPGINWSITDLLIGVMTLPKLSAVGVAAASGASVFAGAALATPIVLGARVATSPIPLACNALANFGFAAVHCVWGSPAIAVACVGWGIASFIIARKQHLALSKKNEQLSSE